MEENKGLVRKNNTTLLIAIAIIVFAMVLILGTYWTGRSASSATEQAVHSVSNFYLQELAGRREQVVASNLDTNIKNMRVALDLMEPDDLSDMVHLQAWQAKMKKLYKLEKFAFVDTNGLIYTSLGTQNNIEDYHFNYKSIRGPEISVKDMDEEDKRVIIAVPVDRISFMGETLVACFMEIKMDVLLEGLSIQTDRNATTYCNLYYKDGTSLTGIVLGGLSEEKSILSALSAAEFQYGSSLSQMEEDFSNGRENVITFVYNGTSESMYYVPVSGTDWMLTYLIRESLISDQINVISRGIIIRNVALTVFMTLFLIGIFAIIALQNRKNAMLALEKETAEAETRVKQQELEEKLALQDKLVEQGESLKDALAVAEQANAAKTSFLSSMSHEIRTPMNAIIGLDSIALKDPDLPPRTREYLEKIGGSAKHLLSLINDILDMSRIESGRMAIKNEEFSFAEMLEQINTMVNGQCQEKGLTYECHINGKVDDYYIGDDMKLKQVIINILGNAVKFTPSPGNVCFTVEPVSRFEDKASMRFIISDTGIGMDKEYIPKIFEAFSQEDENKANKYGSTGLGMAITKNIVEMMNGNISVESEKGVGSTFTVTVTLRTTDKTGKEAVSDIRPQEMNVLVIDDDPIACEHAKLVLEEVGIASDFCYSGKEALEMLRLAHARREAYNLILVDLKMPEKDGVEVTKEIRDLYNGESTIIILTAYSWDDVMEDAINAGVDSFMAKPLFASSVLEEFKQAIKRKTLVRDEEHRAELSGRKVLLAEDVMINAEIMQEILDMWGMKADHAENGKICVEMYEKSPENYYSAVLMDVRMPVMTGLEAAEAIRALNRPDAKTIPIIALTANAFDEDVERSLQAGMNAHLSKPVEPEHLKETLEILIKD